MPAPSTVSEFVELVQKSGVVDNKKLDAYVEKLRTANTLPAKPTELAGFMIRDGLLTTFQAEQFLMGKWRRFTVGKYKVLEKLGSGGMGQVFLCEHKLMRRRVAVKVLPTAKAEDQSALDRFYREARAVAALDHPNIVRAYDIDQDDKLHFLVMEYVDGASLQDIIKKSGPMEVSRACHYIRQSALGLQHAHEAAGLVHRDIKPGNILVDRTGQVKVLDMGLARFFNDEEDNITKKYDENVLGTADYLAPEQALNSHDVDIRADIYSLGATFYFCLTGKTPFADGTVAQKLIWHQTRLPKPIKSLRPDVPDGVINVIDRMMAKEPGQRFQSPMAVADALEVFIEGTIPPPPDSEMPRLSPAAMGGPQSVTEVPMSRSASGPPSPGPQRNWQVPPPPPSSRPTNAPVSPKSAPKVSPGAPTQPSRKSTTSPKAAAPTATPPPVSPPGKKAPLQRSDTRPRSVPNGKIGGPAVTDSVTEEDNVSWEKMVADTARPSGKVDTSPNSEKKPSSRKNIPSGKPAPRSAWRIGLIVGISVVGFLFISGIGFCLAYFLGVFGGPATSTGPQGPLGQEIVTLSWKGEADAASWKEAFKKVRPGSGKILILDEDITEPLVLGKQPGFIPPVSGVTIEPAPGKVVRWHAPAAPSTTRLIWLYKVENLTIRNLKLDGEGKTEEIITLNHLCSNLILDSLDIKGFTRCGVMVADASGEEGKPIRFESLKLGPPAPPPMGAQAGVGVAIQSKGSLSSAGVVGGQHLVFRNCTFDCEPFLVSGKPPAKVDLSQGNTRIVPGQPAVPVTALPSPK